MSPKYFGIVDLEIPSMKIEKFFQQVEKHNPVSFVVKWVITKSDISVLVVMQNLDTQTGEIIFLSTKEAQIEKFLQLIIITTIIIRRIVLFTRFNQEHRKNRIDLNHNHKLSELLSLPAIYHRLSSPRLEENWTKFWIRRQYKTHTAFASSCLWEFTNQIKVKKEEESKEIAYGHNTDLCKYTYWWINHWLTATIQSTQHLFQWLDISLGVKTVQT